MTLAFFSYRCFITDRYINKGLTLAKTPLKIIIHTYIC